MKLPRLSGSKVIKILLKQGFKIVRQKGSHIILVKELEEYKRVLVVPNHSEIDKGTLLEIIRQAGLTKKEVINLL